MDAPNAADRKSIRKQEKAQRQAELLRRDAIVASMSTSNGRAWLWDVLASAHCFHTTHVAGDALASAFQEGRRSLGLAVLSDIMAHCPDLYIQAMREANERHIQPDPHAAAADPHAERLGSPVPNGGDPGALPDSSADPDPADTPSYSAPGADIYAPS